MRAIQRQAGQWRRTAMPESQAVFWHLTENPNFVIDPNYKPNDQRGRRSKESFMSLSEAEDLPDWYRVLSSKGWTQRTGRGAPTHVVEIELPSEMKNKDLGWAYSSFVGEVRAGPEALSQAKIRRILPVDDVIPADYPGGMRRFRVTSHRTAMPTYYHVTPASNRDSITQYGLDYTRGKEVWPGAEGEEYERGNFFWDDEEDARAYADQMNSDKTREEANFIALPFDYEGPVWDDPEGLDGSFYTQDPIPPEAFRHVHRTASGCTCWEGYERVPGTEPCADGSCRKKTKKKTSAAPATQSVEDILTEFTQKVPRKWQDTQAPSLGTDRDKDLQCVDCTGQGYIALSPYQFTSCTSCDGLGHKVPTTVERTVRPSARKLEKALYQEFMDWWGSLDPATRRRPEQSRTNWSAYPDEPVTHWLNVEDFLKERYPDSATGSQYGYESASPKMEQRFRMSPEELEAEGYTATGNLITQVMLNLHNQKQDRKFENKRDRRRYYEFMLRHIGPDARKKAVRLAALVDALALDALFDL